MHIYLFLLVGVGAVCLLFGIIWMSENSAKWRIWKARECIAGLFEANDFTLFEQPSDDQKLVWELVRRERTGNTFYPGESARVLLSRFHRENPGKSIEQMCGTPSPSSR